MRYIIMGLALFVACLLAALLLIHAPPCERVLVAGHVAGCAPVRP